MDNKKKERRLITRNEWNLLFLRCEKKAKRRSLFIVKMNTKIVTIFLKVINSLCKKNTLHKKIYDHHWSLPREIFSTKIKENIKMKLKIEPLFHTHKKKSSHIRWIITFWDWESFVEQTLKKNKSN